MKILIALPGLHMVSRGAETFFENLAEALVARGHAVTLVGGGEERSDGRSYDFVHVPLIPRERFRKFPGFPPLRSEYRWEELLFSPGLARTLSGKSFDVVMTCSYPFVHWTLQLFGRGARKVFVTENGDWPAQRRNLEYRLFSCDGLVCTNPEYYDRNAASFVSALIPNGMDPLRFMPGPGLREKFVLPADSKILLIVSALIPSKRVADGIRAAALMDDVYLVVAGDGPLRSEIETLAAELLPGRFRRLSLDAADMPDLYRSADALLHLSREEAFGNIYIEALSCGLPVVAFDYPTARWILGAQGFFFSEDADATVAAIRRAFAAGRADAHRRHESAAERYSWGTIALQYEQFFLQLTGVSVPAPSAVRGDAV